MDDWGTLRKHKRQGYTTIDSDVIREHGPKIGALGIAVYNVLCMYEGEGKGWPSVDEIAALLGASRAQAQTGLVALLDAGLIDADAGDNGVQP